MASKKFFYLVVVLVSVVMAVGCKPNKASVPRANPASYIKTLSVNREGSDGLSIQMVLADAAGNYTIEEGTLSIRIAEERKDIGGRTLRVWQEPLFTGTIPVSKDRFQSSSSSTYAYWVSPRIAYSQFTSQPWIESKGPYLLGGLGKLTVSFATQSGNTLKGEADIGL
jgi:hypothetical protein